MLPLSYSNKHWQHWAPLAESTSEASKTVKFEHHPGRRIIPGKLQPQRSFFRLWIARTKSFTFGGISCSFKKKMGWSSEKQLVNPPKPRKAAKTSSLSTGKPYEVHRKGSFEPGRYNKILSNPIGNPIAPSKRNNNWTNSHKQSQFPE